MRIDGVVSCQHRRLVLVTLDGMGGYMCFLFPRESKILGNEKITAMKLMEVLSCSLRISEPCRCESWKQCHCPQSPVATLECWRRAVISDQVDVCVTMARASVAHLQEENLIPVLPGFIWRSWESLM